MWAFQFAGRIARASFVVKSIMFWTLQKALTFTGVKIYVFILVWAFKFTSGQALASFLLKFVPLSTFYSANVVTSTIVKVNHVELRALFEWAHVFTLTCINIWLFPGSIASDVASVYACAVIEVNFLEWMVTL